MADPVTEWEERNRAKRQQLEADLERRGETAGARTLKSLDRILERQTAELQRRQAWAAKDPAKIQEHQPAKLTREERRQNLARWLDVYCRVPPAYRGCLRSTWRDSWLGKATPWDPRLTTWSGSPWCLTLRGKPGTGKTHAAVAVMVAWAQDEDRRGSWATGTGGYFSRVRFVSVPRVVRDLQDHFQRDNPREVYGEPLPEHLNRIFQSYDFVIADDVGGQPDADNWIARVSGWLYDRHAAQLPTIVTLNPGPVVGLEDRAARRVSDGLVIDF